MWIGRSVIAAAAAFSVLVSPGWCFGAEAPRWRLQVYRGEGERTARCDPSVAPIIYGDDRDEAEVGGEQAAVSRDGSRFAVVVYGPDHERQEVRILDQKGKVVRRLFVTDRFDCKVGSGANDRPPVPRRVLTRVAGINAFLRRGGFRPMQRVQKDERQSTDQRVVLRRGDLSISFDDPSKKLSATAGDRQLLATALAPMKVRGPQYPGLDCSGARDADNVHGWTFGDWLLIEVNYQAPDECNVLGLSTWIGPIRLSGVPHSAPRSR